MSKKEVDEKTPDILVVYDEAEKLLRQVRENYMKDAFSQKQIEFSVIPALKKMVKKLDSVIHPKGGDAVSQLFMGIHRLDILKQAYIFLLGQMLKRVNQYKESVKYYLECLKLAKTVYGDGEDELRLSQEIVVHLEVCRVLIDIGDIKKACEYAFLGLSKVKQIDGTLRKNSSELKIFDVATVRERKGNFYRELAYAYQRLKTVKLAFKYYVFAEAIISKQQYTRSTAFFYTSYTDFLHGIGCVKIALYLMKRNLKNYVKLFGTSSRLEELTNMYCSSAWIYEANGKIEQAFAYLKKAVEISRKFFPVGMSRQYGIHLVDFFRFVERYQKFGGIQKAKTLAKEAEDVLEKYKQEPTISDLFVVITRVLKADPKVKYKVEVPQKRDLPTPNFMEFSKEELVELGEIYGLKVSIDMNNSTLVGIVKEKYGKEVMKMRSKNAVLGNSCRFCGETEKKLFCCIRCKKVYYCGRTCQKKDWKRHKKRCKPVKTST